MSVLTDETLDYFRQLADEHHEQCVQDGCQKQHEAQWWRIIHGTPAATVKRGA